VHFGLSLAMVPIPGQPPVDYLFHDALGLKTGFFSCFPVFCPFPQNLHQKPIYLVNFNLLFS
jgi:hypothetical protein